MRMRYFSSFLLGMCLLLAAPAQSRDKHAGESHAIAPLLFRENKGQIIDQFKNARTDIDFSLSGQGLSAFIGQAAIHYQWIKPVATPVAQNSFPRTHTIYGQTMPLQWETYRMDVLLLGANKDAQLIKNEPQSYYEHYYLPQFGEQGIHISSFEKMTYKNIYPNIDWVLYIKDQGLEYDFIIHPGGRVSDIRIQYKGAEQLGIGEDGSFFASSPMGRVSESAPVSFQENGKPVSSAFVLQDEILTFRTGSYEGRLTIDPKVKWATYYGGTGGIDWFLGGCIDASNNLYASGTTTSANNIATTGSYQSTLAGGLWSDGMLVKFNTDGKRLWATYYGGDETDEGTGSTLDSLGNVYMCGMTSSPIGIATTAAHQSNYSNEHDAFLVKFDTTGKRLWGTYYGGRLTEAYPAVAYSNGYVYMAGATASDTAIGTSGAFRPKKRGDTAAMQAGGFNIYEYDAYLVKFNMEGKRQWGTYFGGFEDESAHTSVATDGNGDIYIAGHTRSIHPEDSIATAGAHQTTAAGSLDLYLAKFNKDGRLQWSTFYGGEGEESNGLNSGSSSVAFDSKNNVYLCGWTESTTNIASPGAQQTVYSGAWDGLLVKFNSDGQRQWGTYFGDTGVENLESPAICIDARDNIFITGTTTSTSNIATAKATQPAFAGAWSLLPYIGDAFLLQYNTNGEKIYGSYFGGPSGDQGIQVTPDGKGDIYILGATNSLSDIATTGSHQDTYPGALLLTSFVAKFCFGYAPAANSINGKDTICGLASETYTLPQDPDVDAYLWTLPDGWEGSSTQNSITVIPNSSSGIITVRLVRCGDTSALSSKTVYLLPSEKPVITVDVYTLSSLDNYKKYQWLLNGVPIPGATQKKYTVTENGEYALIVENSYGCTDTSDIYLVNNVAISGRDTDATTIRIYPNPATDQVQVIAPAPLTLELTSLDGRILLRKEKSNTLHTGKLARSVYLLRLYTTEGSLLTTRKIIITGKQ